MNWLTTKTQALVLQEQFNEKKREHFRYLLGEGGHYTAQQKEYVSDHIQEFGIRATARILRVPRRTIQRWCRKYNVSVKRCPGWVFDWAERRRKRREFLARRGYG